jgi:hypothetical protein
VLACQRLLSRERKRLAAIRCQRIPPHRTGKDRIGCSYSAETSARAKSRYMAKLFSSAWPLSSCSLGFFAYPPEKVYSRCIPPEIVGL